MVRALEVAAALVLSLACFPRATAQDVSNLRACEVAFAMDGSDSMTDDQFLKIQGFVGEVILAGIANYGQPDGLRCGVLQFGDSSNIEMRLGDFTDAADAAQFVSDITRFGGITNTHLAIEDMIEILDEGLRSNFKAGVIITDGNSDEIDSTRRKAAEFKNKRFKLIIIGIGTRINHAEMRLLASSPDVYFEAEDFAELGALAPEIIAEVCVPPCPINPEDVCEVCQYTNGVYLYPDCNVCHKYKQCLQHNVHVTMSRFCPFGQFFDYDTLTCRLAGEIFCFNDHCRLGEGTFEYDISCRAYWVCDQDRAVDAKCCDVGFRYDSVTNGCVPDASCTDDCPPFHPEPACTRSAIAGRPNQFRTQRSFNSFIIQDCAQGTEFNSNTCDCSQSGAITERVCGQDDHILYIPFTTNSKDYRSRVGVKNPRPNKVRKQSVNNEMVGRFNGGSRLIVNGLSNYFWGDKLVVRVLFQETAATPSGPEVIFGNGDCGKGESISVKYNRATGTVDGMIVISDGAGGEQTKNVTVSGVAPGGLKSVELRYTGERVTLTVDGISDSVVTNGNIARRHCALQFGAGASGGDRFTGYLDEIYVYTPCLPP